MTSKTYDVIIIGAGPTGLVFAKTYLRFHPNARLVMLDAYSSLGGTWSKERMYKDLKTNNLLGTYEFPGFPMDASKYGLVKGQPVPGLIVHQYMADYAKVFDLSDKIIYQQTVTNLEKEGTDGWKISTVKTGNRQGPSETYFARKVIIASGLTSEPQIPDFSGASEFQGSSFHIKDLGWNISEVAPGSRIAVIGGAKSAYDAIYNFASAGHEVEWIVRPGGRGPAWMSHPYVTPLKLWLEQLVSTRLLTWLVPCTWGHADGYSWARWFLHETWFGRKVVAGFAAVMDGDLAGLTGYDNHESTKKLKPWFSSLNVGANLSILNYPTDFYEHVRSGRVRVHIADVSHISKDSVHLSTGEKLKADTIFYATGWQFVPKFLKGLEADLGIVDHHTGPDDVARKADLAILAKYPQLAEITRQWPASNASQPSDSTVRAQKAASAAANSDGAPSFRLHRFLVPPRYFDARSIVLASSCFSLRTLVQAHVSALWTVAYFDGALTTQQQQQEGQQQQRPSVDEIEYEAALHAQSGKWTTPGGYAGRVPDIVFQQVPWMDLLLSDLGLQRWRKIEDSRGNGGWFSGLRGRVREVFEPYMPLDYRGVEDEWARMQKKGQ